MFFGKVHDGSFVIGGGFSVFLEVLAGIDCRLAALFHSFLSQVPVGEFFLVPIACFAAISS